MKRTRNKWVGILGTLLVALVACPASTWAGTIVINEGSSEYAQVGMEGAAQGVATEGNYFVYDGSGAVGTVTATPGQSGLHWVQARWYAAAGANASIRYRVNHVGGTTDVIVNQQQTAAQGAATGAPGTLPFGSGWYTLGRFQMNSSSTVVAQDSGGANGMNYDALRVSDTSYIVDMHGAKMAYTGTWGGPYNNTGQPADAPAGVSSAFGGSPLLTVTPGYAGKGTLYASWQVHSLHAGAADYVVDPDGIAGNGDEVTVTLSQQLLAGGGSGANGDWSGWASLGMYDLTANSVVRLAKGSGSSGGYLSTSNFLVEIPEPATMSLLVAGLAALGLRRQRRGA